jgi:hypothetical protein
LSVSKDALRESGGEDTREVKEKGRAQLKRIMESYLSEDPAEIAQFIVDHIEVSLLILV